MVRYLFCRLRGHGAYPVAVRRAYRYWCRTCQRGWGRV